MKKFIFLIIFYPMTFLSADESNFKIIFGSSIKKFPIEINNLDKDISKPLGIKINNWILSPVSSKFVNQENIKNSIINKNFKDSLFVKFRFQF